jgi:transcriptional regulator GlxA family with amidase domain
MIVWLDSIDSRLLHVALISRHVDQKRCNRVALVFLMSGTHHRSFAQPRSYQQHIGPGREMLLRVAELVPKHPGRHKKPGAKADGAGGSGVSSSGGTAAAGSKQSAKKGKKKK